MILEESLNGGYKGLFGEVVTSDQYRIRKVEDIVSVNDPTFVHVKGHERAFDFIPDVVIDLGANVGIFSMYARSLFPEALIISVEPDPENVKVFREHTNDDRIILIQKAIGSGQIYRVLGALNGAHEVYLSANIGYSDSDLMTFDKSPVKSILLTDLKRFIKSTDRVILKMDIEGNELAILTHKPSMDMIKAMDYITGELHYFAANGQKLPGVVEQTDKALRDLSETHHVTIMDRHFYAVKK